MTKLSFCKNCKEYSLDTKCKICGLETVSKYPPKFSPQDHYGAYRRKLKKLENEA